MTVNELIENKDVQAISRNKGFEVVGGKCDNCFGYGTTKEDVEDSPDTFGVLDCDYCNGTGFAMKPFKVEYIGGEITAYFPRTDSTDYFVEKQKWMNRMVRKYGVFWKIGFEFYCGDSVYHSIHLKKKLLNRKKFNTIKKLIK